MRISRHFLETGVTALQVGQARTEFEKCPGLPYETDCGFSSPFLSQKVVTQYPRIHRVTDLQRSY